ncbi:hypothetical protein [Corynebacterium gerontici]|uniref:hypothetical protein n=1 Tax=Corynebacterium gerontici TaxID=2079234 RepID=UPI000F50CB58|nr:hypothetical protein [Corynebacterium gerontici]
MTFQSSPALATFSTVSGLDQLGAQHAGVLAGGPGSAASVVRSLMEQVSWLQKALSATVSSLDTQNSFVQRAMDVADEGGYVGDMIAPFPMRPLPTIPGFSFAPPAMIPATSVAQLAAQFSATNEAVGLDGARQWTQLAGMATSVASSLESVAAQVASSARGVAFDRATANISEVAATAANFAANCEVMATSVTQMVGIHQRHLPQVMAAEAQVQAAPDPRAKVAAEQAALSQLNAAIAADLPTGIPPIRSLVSALPGGLSGGAARTGMGLIPGKGRLSTAGLGATGAPVQAPSAMGAGAQSPGGSFESVAVSAQEAAPQAMSQVATQQASLAQGPGQFAQTATQGPAGGSPAGFGGSQAGAGGSQPSFASPIGAQPLGSGLGSQSTSVASNAQSGSTTTKNPGSLGALSGLKTPKSAREFGGSSAAMTGALAAGGAALGMGGLGGASGAGSPGALGSKASGLVAATGVSGGANAGGGASTSAMRGTTGGVAPMMGAHPRQERRSSKVKSVTSTLEKNHNLRELLGEQEPVVPRMIGAWVRQ